MKLSEELPQTAVILANVVKREDPGNFAASNEETGSS
jgi:hypothetical protein